MPICRVCAVADCSERCHGCNVIPFCSQQHARDNEREHAMVCSEFLQLHGDVLEALEPSTVNPTLIANAFTGDIKSMVELLQSVPRQLKPGIKKAILQLFPKVDESEVRRALALRLIPATERLQALYAWKYE
jgi:hypothetical protein